MVETNIPLAVMCSILYAVILNLSKGVQKYGIAGLSLETIKRWKERPELKRNFKIWLIGSLGTVVSVIFQFVGQLFVPEGNSSFLPAFSGVGLMALVIFSYFMLKEKIRAPEIIGTIIILISTVIYGLSARDAGIEVETDYVLFFYVALIPLIMLFVIGIISVKHNHKGHAIIWGTIAGFFAGLAIPLSQTSIISGGGLGGALGTWDLYLAIVLGQLAFIFTQYGFAHGQATIVVTLYNTLMLGVPVIIDIVVLQQQMGPIELLMLLFIGIGVILLTAFRHETTLNPDELKIK
jgi:uncharacterized membrane protein